jgi:hypothetical protein
MQLANYYARLLQRVFLPTVLDPMLKRGESLVRPPG